MGNSIQISSIEEIQPLKHLLTVSYKCQNCGKDVTIRVKALKNKNRSTLKCTSCYKKETMIEKYGTTSNFGRKEVQEKSQNTLEKRYGGKTPLQCKNIKEKYEQTCLEKYGSISPLGNKHIREKIQQTSLERYGTKTPLENKDILNKTIETIKEKYDVENVFELEKFRNAEKRKETISNFSKEKLHQIRKKQSKRYFYDDIYFQSSWEVAFYIYSKDFHKNIHYEPTYFNYEYDEKIYRYFPDFLIDGKLYEIKGDHFFDNNKMICPFDRELDNLYEAKHQCMIENNVQIIKNKDIEPIITYINKKYGKHFLSSLKTKRKIKLEKQKVKKIKIKKQKYKWTSENNPMFDEKSVKKRKKTVLEKYGGEILSNKEIRKKISNTIKEKYGVEWFTQIKNFYSENNKSFIEKTGMSFTEYNSKFRRKRYLYDNEYFDSSIELYFWIYCKDNNLSIKKSDKKFEYDFNGKTHNYFPDFEVDDKIIEIKGKHFLENGKWVNPFFPEQNDLYETKHQCALKNNVTILYSNDCGKYIDYVNNKYTKDFIDLFLVDLPFPYLNIDLKTKTDNGIIRHFHKSIYSARRNGKLSPIEAWNNKNLIKEIALNRLQYVNRCRPSDILQGFSVTRKAQKISVFKPELAKKLLQQYSHYDLIIDPFSGFSGRLIGSMNCGKQYIGRDINEDHVRESNEIIKYKKYQNCSVETEDLINAPVREYENSTLFTCSPYNDKEIWNENETNLSCDEWIDLCLEKYWCSEYIFVVDITEKYKDYIVETITNKSHFGKNNEYVLFFSRNQLKTNQ